MLERRLIGRLRVERSLDREAGLLKCKVLNVIRFILNCMGERTGSQCSSLRSVEALVYREEHVTTRANVFCTR